MFETNRRAFLSGIAAMASLPLTARLTFAARGPEPERRFVLIILRGAADGLGIIPPVGDPDYATMRDALAFDPKRLTALDDRFSMNPALASLEPWYRAKELLFVHAVASQYRERSHFDAQAVLESGRDDPKRVSDGWLARTLNAMEGGPRSLAIGGGVPAVLSGGKNVMTWSPGRTRVPDQNLLERLAMIYDHDSRLSAFGPDIRRSAGLIDGAMSSQRGASSVTQRAFGTAGQLLMADGGPTIAVISTDGWDTHHGQGLESGRLSQAVLALCDGLLALRGQLSDNIWAGTTILVVSEFGRTVAMNGSAGTDHGTGGLAMLAGGTVAGGRVVSDWPGLSLTALYEKRDLAPTTDTRALMKAVLREQLGVPDRVISEVAFPGSEKVKAVDGLFRS
ncbi:DUF1501 domain-containing protein [Tistrella bauzanensis]|uniref:DUF1501 domain-containing protein n=1 Tax=Tistrella arctica TaxID=3133430 RepID=A0ABU9YD86_9PROT